MLCRLWFFILSVLASSHVLALTTTYDGVNFETIDPATYSGYSVCDDETTECAFLPAVYASAFANGGQASAPGLSLHNPDGSYRGAVSDASYFLNGFVCPDGATDPGQCVSEGRAFTGGFRSYQALQNQQPPPAPSGGVDFAGVLPSWASIYAALLYAGTAGLLVILAVSGVKLIYRVIYEVDGEGGFHNSIEDGEAEAREAAFSDRYGGQSAAFSTAAQEGEGSNSAELPYPDLPSWEDRFAQDNDPDYVYAPPAGHEHLYK